MDLINFVILYLFIITLELWARFFLMLRVPPKCYTKNKTLKGKFYEIIIRRDLLFTKNKIKNAIVNICYKKLIFDCFS